MTNQFAATGMPGRHEQLLTTLEGLLAIRAAEAKSTLTQAADLVAETLDAEKIDIFLNDPAVDTLVAVGVSDTPMGRRQIELGLNRLPISNGGRAAEVFQRGDGYFNGHVDEDPEELHGIKHALGVRSALMVPLDVDGVRRGVVQATSAQPDRFSADDLPFLAAVARWVSLVLHQAEMVERLTQAAAEEARRTTANELITMLAHDLRAPLVPLRGYLDMIHTVAQREGQDQYLHYATRALRSANRLQHMLSDLMDTARLEQDLFALSLEAVNLPTLVQETADMLRSPAASIDVRTPDHLVVEADSGRLRQALENLLSNALRYSPDGVPVVAEVRTERRADKNYAVITVQDAGPGIAPEVLPRLFTRFAGGGDKKGLGLGLYLARGIAEAHAGTLTVDSAPGTGACFRLALPLEPSTTTDR